MTKLCPRGKAAAKRKFKVYPSAYANAYASRICAGKIKDPSGVKRKDFKGRKPAQDGGPIGISPFNRRKTFRELKEPVKTPIMRTKTKAGENARKMFNLKMKQFEKLKELKKNQRPIRRKKMMGGGLMEATQRLRRQGLKKGGGVDTGKEGERRSRIATVLSRYTAKTRGPKRTEKMGGGMMRPMYETGGNVARGCGAIMSNRSKKTKTF